MKHLLFGVFFLLGSLLVSAQYTISGTIIDNNNEPVPGAEIYIEELHIGTVADFDGQYALQQVPKGVHRLTIQFLGFETFNQKIEIDSDQTLDVTMESSVFHMDEVIVSAPFNRLQRENIMKIETRTIEALKKEGGVTLMENLSHIPGVNQTSTGTGIGKPVIRGLSGNRVLVYTQGVRLENQQFGAEHGLGLSDSGMENVEVIKGPASLLYGSDALGGVLYFNPERFANQGETRVSIDQQFASNTLGSTTSAGVATSGTKFKFLARGGYNTHSDYRVPGGDGVHNSRFKEGDIKLGAGLNLDNFVTELRYNYNQATFGIPEEVEEFESSKEAIQPYQEIGTHLVSLHNHFFFGQSKIDLNLGFTANNRKEFEDHHHEHEGEEGHKEEGHEEEGHEEEEEEDGHAALEMQLNTFTYDLKYHFPKRGKFETIAGIQGLHQTNVNHGEEILIPDARTNDVGLLLTSIFEINDQHQLQGGLRYDNRRIESDPFEKEIEHHHEEEDGHEEGHEEEDHETVVIEGIDRSFDNMTFSLGYKANWLESVQLRLNLATGYRAPNLAELTSFGVHHGSNRFEIGNPDLSSEQNFQTDLSLEYGNKHIEVFVNGFYNRMFNYIYANPTGDEIDESPVYEYIQNDARLYGGEFGFHLHPHPLDWLHLESSYEMVIGELDNGDYLPLIPANRWTNTIRGEFKGSDRFNQQYVALILDSFFEQNKVAMNETETPGYNLLNFHLGGTFQFKKAALGVRLGVNNLLDTEYISHLSRLKADGIPNQGRNFVIGLNLGI